VARQRDLKKPAVRPRMSRTGGRTDERAVIDTVGVNCASFRRERGLSLDALSRLSGISKGMLIEIEQKRTNPSIATVCRIANALNVGLAEILNEKPASARVVRHTPGMGKELWRTAAGSTAVLIDAARVLNVGGELWRWSLAPSESFEGARHPEGTHEFLYVLRGTLAVDVAGETAQCVAHESLRIRADAPHTYRNPEGVTCEFVMCVIEPIAK
jgi:mannose-6-phosphate isomerase-like protein (cupin superfamily)